LFSTSSFGEDSTLTFVTLSSAFNTARMSVRPVNKYEKPGNFGAMAPLAASLSTSGPSPP